MIFQPGPTKIFRPKTPLLLITKMFEYVSESKRKINKLLYCLHFSPLLHFSYCCIILFNLKVGRRRPAQFMYAYILHSLRGKKIVLFVCSV